MKPMNIEYLFDAISSEDATPFVYSNSYNDNFSAIGAFVWNARIHLSLSAGEFANRCGVDEDDILHIENDAHYNPDIRTLEYISRFLNIKSQLLAEIAGYKKIRDESYENQLYAFAAHSRQLKDTNDLSQEIFEQYLAVIHERGMRNE